MLPDKPSELIELALGDLRRCEADDRYVIDMVQIHELDDDGKCNVCFAGAVLAQTIGLQPNVSTEVIDVLWNKDEKYEALDNFRCGQIHMGLLRMGVVPPVGLAAAVRI